MCMNYQTNPDKRNKEHKQAKHNNEENPLEYLNHYLIHLAGTHSPGLLELILSDFVVQLCWLFKILKI